MLKQLKSATEKLTTVFYECLNNYITMKSKAGVYPNATAVLDKSTMQTRNVMMQIIKSKMTEIKT